MKLPIVYYGNPILRKRAEPIKEVTEDIRQLVLDMVETMDANNGIGLAAPQVGRSLRLFVLRNYIEAPDGRLSISTEFEVYINPKITFHSDELLLEPEGCLSVPGINGDVLRPDRIIIEALDINGKFFVQDLQGYNARVRMHENDHINGVLFIDRVDAPTRRKLDPLLRQIKKKYAANNTTRK